MPDISMGRNEPGTVTRVIQIGSNPPSVTTYAGVSKRFDIFRSGLLTPNFRSKRPKWTLPMNNHTSVKEEQIKASGTLVEWSNMVGNPPFRWWKTTWSGPLDRVQPPQYVSYLTLSAKEIEAIDAHLRNKIRLKIKDQKVNLAQAYAERAQSARLIADAAIKCAYAYASLKKGDIKNAARVLGVTASRKSVNGYKRAYAADRKQAASDAWLQLQYGWKPLLSDVYGSAELLAQAATREIRDKATVFQSVEREDYHRGYETTSVNPKLIDHVTRKTTYLRKYVIYYSTSQPTLHTVSQAGISNPALLAWELLPFSFVVDWFLPIGTFLSSLDATLGLTFEKGCVSELIRYDNSNAQLADGKYNVNGYYETGQLTSKKWRSEFRRTKITSFPLPSLPRFENPLSFTRAANAIALLSQTFRK